VPSSRRQQARQSGEVVGGHRQDEAFAHPLNAAIDGLSPAADCLGPAERLFDPSAVLDGQGITPNEYIGKIWASEPDRFILDSIQLMPGLNTKTTGSTCR
jgi:hypothetical protein